MPCCAGGFAGVVESRVSFFFFWNSSDRNGLEKRERRAEIKSLEQAFAKPAKQGIHSDSGRTAHTKKKNLVWLFAIALTGNL
jgi:hypothetical protein